MSVPIKLSDDDIRRVANTLAEAGIPEENRVMYYLKISWWRHPIRRYRQIRAIRWATQSQFGEKEQ